MSNYIGDEIKMKAREYWLEFKNGAAWEFSNKPAPHRECILVREVLPNQVTLTRDEAVHLFADMDCSLVSALKALEKLFGKVKNSEEK